MASLNIRGPFSYLLTSLHSCPKPKESRGAVDQVKVPGQHSGGGSRLDPNYLDLGNL
jgi:hypothetical protein